MSVNTSEDRRERSMELSGATGSHIQRSVSCQNNAMIGVHSLWTLMVKRKRQIVAALLFNFVLSYAIYSYYLGFSRTRTDSTTNSNAGFRFWEQLNVWNSRMISDNSTVDLDLHLEFGDAQNHQDYNWENVTHVVAIGMGITSRGIENLNENSIATDFQLFTTFLPSFCKTASLGYGYAFYMAFDYSDSAFANPTFLNVFQRTFRTCMDTNCPSGIRTSLHMVQCSHAAKPAWAQNDAMLDAYLDNVEYFYRINDDTVLETKQWTETFISKLKRYDPPNLGVVGPTHAGGNTEILTYDFVHRTHVDVLGFYYPRLFTDWWGDDWVTNVYMPGRTTKLADVTLQHTMKGGQRYAINNWDVANKLHVQVSSDKEIINRYLKSVQLKNAEQPNGKKIISMSLFGKDPKFTWGAIRNAQLVRVYFPGWRLRFYIPNPDSYANGERSSWIVPERIVRKLKQLGAEIVHLPKSLRVIPPQCWRYLVADDVKISHFLIRDADSRLNERDAVVIEEWVRESQNSKMSLHCIRDHPSHVGQNIVDGLWGGNGQQIRNTFQQQTMLIQLKQFFTNIPEIVPDLSKFNKLDAANPSTPSANDQLILANKTSSEFLSTVLWPLLSPNHISHDCVSIHRSRPNLLSINLVRKNCEYLGQEFNEHHQLISTVNLNDTWCSTGIESVTQAVAPVLLG